MITIHGKGLGVVAGRFLSRGTKIIIEEALLLVPSPGMETGQGARLEDMLNNVEKAFESLDHSSQQEFLQLHDHRFPGDGDRSRLLTIFRSNAYSTGDNLVGLFPKIARINHSCQPNAGNFWSFKENHRVIYAHRDIEVGEELQYFILVCQIHQGSPGEIIPIRVFV